YREWVMMQIVESLSSLIMNEGTELKYTYRLTQNKYKGNEAYGIEVEKQQLKDGQTINIDRDRIDLISNNKYKVNNLLELLFKNLVSPIHLVEILGEYVDGYVYDFDDVRNANILN
ncbi:MAG: DUF6514 family protein, partial [Clostridium sp.]